MDHLPKTPTILYTASRRKSTKPRHKNEVQCNVFEDEELEETCFTDIDTDQQNIQKIKITLEGQRSKPYGSPFVPQQDGFDEETTSDSSNYSDSRMNGADVEMVPIRKPIYWLEMRGIQPVPSVSAQQPPMRGGMLLSRKRGLPDEDEDYEVYPTKIISPRSQRFVHDGMNFIPKPKSRYVKKEPPSYPQGSQEELWHLEILDRGKVTCPSCRAVVRKTVEGLKKHMANCRQEPYTCQHCGKQLKSLAGMKYHIMADHNNKPLSEDGDGPSERERLRKVLKRLGKLKCSREGCTASFASIMGYMYHMKKCGKEASELEEMMLKCTECGKRYNSKAGLDYHTRSEHAPASLPLDSTNEDGEAGNDLILGEKSQRRSAKVAAFHLQQIASEELTKEWPKRRVLEDLVPDDRKLKYTRPGMPTFSQEVIRKWNNEIKIYRKVQCPNKGCDSVYTSVSGLKAHLGCCHMGDFAGGTYRCLLCDKQFHSESGVKYHITSVHSQEWFVVNPKTTKSFAKQMKTAHKEDKLKKQKKRFITRVLAVKRADNSLKATPRNNILVRQEKPQIVEISSESEGNNSDVEEHVFMRPNWNIKNPMTKVMMKTVHGRK